jgi:hypothetical protein
VAESASAIQDIHRRFSLFVNKEEVERDARLWGARRDRGSRSDIFAIYLHPPIIRLTARLGAPLLQPIARCWRYESAVCGTIPGTPRSHSFVERLIGTVRRELLDRTSFWGSGRSRAQAGRLPGVLQPISLSHRAGWPHAGSEERFAFASDRFGGAYSKLSTTYSPFGKMKFTAVPSGIADIVLQSPNLQRATRSTTGQGRHYNRRTMQQRNRSCGRG